MAAAKKERKRMGGKLVGGWWRTGEVPLTDLNTVSPGPQDAESVVMSAADLLPQPAAVIDRSRWVTVVRIICRIILVITSGGGSGAGRFYTGFRKTEGGAGDLSVRMLDADDRQEDWWYRKTASYNVFVGQSRNVVLNAGTELGELVIDCQPNRRMLFGEELLLSYSIGEPISPITGGHVAEMSADVSVYLKGLS